MNAGGTIGVSPSAVTGRTDQLVYQQMNGRRTTSDLYLYNLSSRIRTKLPGKIDTKGWEYTGVASNAYVLFMRWGTKTRDLLLYNRSTHALTKLASVKKRCLCLWPTWVGTSHAMFDKCKVGAGCNVFVWTSGGSSAVITNAGPLNSLSFVGGGMDETDPSNPVVYYAKTTTWCGLFVEIDRVTVLSGGTTYPFVVALIPEGADVLDLSVAPSTTTPGNVDIDYSQYDCLRSDADIFWIADANTT